jgi:hypothetical protein
LQAGGIFACQVTSKLHPQQEYSLETSSAETYSGRVQFLRAHRGFCVSIRELNDALLWVAIEGAPEKSKCKSGTPHLMFRKTALRILKKRWSAQLHRIFP